MDAVVAEAVGDRLPGADALRETLRRRRASGGPAEQTFATVVGLELRPRRLRDAAELWRRSPSSAGSQGRDALWAHPDLIPTADDLDDPAAFVAREELRATRSPSWRSVRPRTRPSRPDDKTDDEEPGARRVLNPR